MKAPTILETKVVRVKAMQIIGGNENLAEITAWVVSEGGKAMPWPAVHDGAEHIVIETLEGPMRADVGDWVLQGLLGEFYPCKDAAKIAKYNEIPTEVEVINTEEPSA